MKRTFSLLVLLLGLGLAQGYLSPAARAGLLEALTGPGGAYQSYAFYVATLGKLGPKEPFRSILNGETQKLRALRQKLEAYGVSYPHNNPYLGRVQVPATLEAARRFAIALETKSIYLEKRVTRAVAGNADLVTLLNGFRLADHVQKTALEENVTHRDDLAALVRPLGDACRFAFGPAYCLAP